jgi:hypothetical protein
MIANGVIPVNEGELIENMISYQGLRGAHVICYGKPVDADAWINQICPDYAQELVHRMVWIEKALGMHHLRFWWNARQVLEFDKRFEAPVRYGVLWYIAKGESLSFAVDLAATLYHRTFGRMPSTAWITKLPKDAAEFIEVIDQDCLMRVELATGEWVPGNRFVVVGCPRDEYDPRWKDGGFSGL